MAQFTHFIALAINLSLPHHRGLLQRGSGQEVLVFQPSLLPLAMAL